LLRLKVAHTDLSFLGTTGLLLGHALHATRLDTATATPEERQGAANHIVARARVILAKTNVVQTSCHVDSGQIYKSDRIFLEASVV
jgi:hypothetical protein